MCKVLVSLFILFAVLYVYSGYKSIKKMEYFSKPFLLPLLAVVYGIAVTDINIYIIMAILFGFLGDFLLMFEGDKFFIGGLLSFLLGHIFYAIVFITGIYHIQSLSLINYLFIIPYIIYGIFIFSILKKYLFNMKKFVVVYIFALIIMSFSSLLYALVSKSLICWVPFMGSLFFILSDSILSIKVFRKEINKGDFWVGITYVIAQALIVIGFIYIS